ATTEQSDRDCGGQNHRDRHGDIATKTGQDLVEKKSKAHLTVHPVHAALFVSHQPAQRQLHDALPHRVDDVVVVSGHQHGGAGAVDPLEQIHDVVAGLRVQVAGGL